MKRFVFELILLVFLALVLSSSAQAHLISMALQSGKTIVVNSTSDSGPGSLREAIKNALPGDSITFDSSVFSTANPDTIALSSPLPELNQGNLTIDASNAGVIIDGSQITNPEFAPGFFITSENNVIRGLQIVGFSDAGIYLGGGSYYNTIGGDRDIGTAPTGQGNIINGNGNCGIKLNGSDISSNTLKGNVIGTDLSGTIDLGALIDGIHCAGASFSVIEDNIIGGTSTGIFICCAEEGRNIIRGNYIGTNGSGSTEIDCESGIVIERSGFNIVGPGNVIAYNERRGIEIRGGGSVGNRITQNSIHDNGKLGIKLYDGCNMGLPAPFILDFDLQAGTLTGWVHPNSIVEIFSDSSEEGAFYEAQAVADSRGFFTFRKEATFTGPHLTATATDPDGNTTEFSLPTGGSSGSFRIQEGNSLVMTALQPKTSIQLPADIRLGTIFYDVTRGDLATLPSLMLEIINMGAKRVDTKMNEFEPPIDWSDSETDIPVEYDRFIDAMNENGVVVNYLLLFWDKVGHASGDSLPNPRFSTEEDIQKFLDYVRYIVNHFKGRVQYYTIWGEQGALGPGSLKGIEPLDYIELSMQTIPVIREIDPQAKVVVGPLVLQYDIDYIYTLVRSNAIQLFDVISTHPFFNAAPDTEEFGNYYYEYPSLIEDILQTASAHEFLGEYWGYSLTWRVNDLHSPLQTIKYNARGTVMHLGLDFGTGTGPFLNPDREPVLYSVVANLYTILAGTESIDLGLEIESDATNIVSYGFTDSNGNKLVALWTDGVAIDNDPGIAARLTFPGLADQRMIGIDVLNGFQQEIFTEVENGNLVIRNLMVKDYPIIISSSSTQVDIATNRIPFTFALHQNYPNPFNSQTTITYELKENAQVSLKIYNIFGQLVETIENDYKTTGYHSVLWNASNVSSGLYFYQIEAGQYTETKRCLILK